MKRRSSQFNLFTKAKFPNLVGASLEHGGETRKGRRKIARPFDSKRAMHVVLRSDRARGELSLLAPRNRKLLERALEIAGSRAQVRVYNRANVGNHIHLILKARTRKDFARFMRILAGRSAALILKAKKGAAKGKFWSELAYSRVLSWGEDFINTQIYLTKNLFEGEGVELPGVDGRMRRYRIVQGALRAGP